MRIFISMGIVGNKLVPESPDEYTATCTYRNAKMDPNGYRIYLEISKHTPFQYFNYIIYAAVSRTIENW